MKTQFSIFFFFLSIVSGMHAHSLTGEYFIAATGGEIVLKLQQNGQNQLTGTMTDLQGVQYYVEDANMMFTFGDGKRQVWKRSY